MCALYLNDGQVCVLASYKVSFVQRIHQQQK